MESEINWQVKVGYWFIEFSAVTFLEHEQCNLCLFCFCNFPNFLPQEVPGIQSQKTKDEGKHDFLHLLLLSRLIFLWSF